MEVSATKFEDPIRKIRAALVKYKVMTLKFYSLIKDMEIY